MRIYEVSDTGVIGEIYKDRDEFKRRVPTGVLYTGKEKGEFKGGYLEEAQVSKMLINGLGGTRNRDYLKLKMDNKAIKQDIETLKADYRLDTKKKEVLTGQLQKEVVELGDTKKQLTKRLEHTSLERDTYKKRVEDALKVIGGGGRVTH